MATETSADAAQQLASSSVAGCGRKSPECPPRRGRRRSTRGAPGDRHPGAPGRSDHRPTQLAAKQHIQQRRSPADRICRHRAERHRAVPGRRRTGRPGEQLQDRAVVDGAQAGPKGRRPRAAHPARERGPGARGAERPGRHGSVEPGTAHAGLPAADFYCPRGPRHGRIRRADSGAQCRASRRATARRAKRL